MKYLKYNSIRILGFICALAIVLLFYELRVLAIDSWSNNEKYNLSNDLNDVTEITTTTTKIILDNNTEITPVKLGYSKEDLINKRIVILTFDDGPSKNTDKIVNILNLYGLHGTFFFLGNNIPEHPEAVINAYNAGNDIANHGKNHKYFTKETNIEVLNEINYTEQLLKNMGVEPARYVRPPYGSIKDSMVEYLGHPIITWNADSLDWSLRDVDKIVAESSKYIDKKGAGDVVVLLMHCRIAETPDSLLTIIDKYKDSSVFMSVSEYEARTGITLENTRYATLPTK